MRLLISNKLFFISFLPYLFWWIAFFPGIIDHDGNSTLIQFQQNNFSNSQTLNWLIWVSVTSGNAKLIWMSTFLQAFLGCLAIGKLFKYFSQDYWHVYTLVFGLIPYVGGFLIHFWHDATFIIGVVIVCETILTHANNISEITKTRGAWILFGIFLISTRHNGLPVLVLFLIILILSIKVSQTRIFLGFLAIFSISIFFIGSLFFQIKPASTSFGLSNFVADIVCVSSKEPDLINAADWEYMVSMAPKNDWLNINACKTANPIFYSGHFKTYVIEKNPRQFLSFWSKVGTIRPNYFIAARLDRADSFLPPILGSIPERMYFLDIWSPVGNYSDVNKIVHFIALSLMMVTVFAAPILGWSGLHWFILTLVLVYLSYMRSKKEYFFIWTFLSLQQIYLIINTQGPDARYGIPMIWASTMSLLIIITRCIKNYFRKVFY